MNCVVFLVRFHLLDHFSAIFFHSVESSLEEGYHYYGNSNTVVGNSAMRNNRYGYENVAIGVNALLGNLATSSISIPLPCPHHCPHIRLIFLSLRQRKSILMILIPLQYGNISIGNGSLGKNIFVL